MSLQNRIVFLFKMKNSMFTEYTRIENIQAIKSQITIYKLHCEKQSHNFHAVDCLVRELKITTKIHLQWFLECTELLCSAKLFYNFIYPCPKQNELFCQVCFGFDKLQQNTKLKVSKKQKNLQNFPTRYDEFKKVTNDI